MNPQKVLNRKRERRHARVRKVVVGLPERPRLCVKRSLKHIYCQIVEDLRGVTLCAASTLSPQLRGKLAQTGNVAAAKEVGKLIAELAKAKGIRKVVFDRASYKFHGRVKALADAAREGGLEF